MGEAPLLNGKRLRLVRRRIIDWFKEHGRAFPWRSANSPFQILIAEVLLRRTTATAVSRVYGEFIDRFATLQKLANARKSTIEGLLSTLGLQSVRADHLKQMAKILLKDCDGVIPDDLASLEGLPGVGKYAAAAVMNFAFGASEPMVDGNVVHLMNRVFSHGAAGPTDVKIWDFMKTFGGPQDKRLYWGIIDLVALICIRRNPRCNLCPLSALCDYHIANPK
ncbi:MAG: hypothetical protein ACFFD6_03610 [Candidatus Thorarchaeota archaeon]